MSYEFFFSYTRGNYSPYLQQFFDDLCSDLRESMGYNRDKTVGFFDQRNIELGDTWDDAIVEALQEAKVMICIYSPGYFNSAYCGKEWQFFHDRRKEYVRLQKQKGIVAPELPPVIIPVLWLAPLTGNLPDAVAEIQYMVGDPAQYHNINGLRLVLQKKMEYNALYVDYIHSLSLRIIEASNSYVLPALNPVPALKELPAPFPMPVKKLKAGNNDSVLSKRLDAKHVRFVFVAGDPNEFGDLRTREAYLDAGGSDWRPFGGMSKIGPYLQHLVSNDDMAFESDKLNLDDNILQEIEKAFQERKIILFVVDRWTVSWNAEYRRILQMIDGEAPPKLVNWSVLVPCNNADPDYCNQKEAIDFNLQQTFNHRANTYKNPTFYRDNIKSADELKTAVREILINIKAELHRNAEVGKVISNHISKPNISNQKDDLNN